MGEIRNRETEDLKPQCQGEPSFGCRKPRYKRIAARGEMESSDSHDRGEEFYCRKCKAYMGCSTCAQIPQELVCLRCHDWALDDGEREHGQMLPRDKVEGAVKKLVSDVSQRRLQYGKGEG